MLRIDYGNILAQRTPQIRKTQDFAQEFNMLNGCHGTAPTLYPWNFSN